MKRLFKWAFYLFILLVVLLVAGVLLLDPIAKEYAQSRLRSETGMDVRIGKMDIGLSTPTIAIENIRFYNTAEFGGSPFLNIPEVFIEYDKQAARVGKLHLKLVRINLEEIDIVQDSLGRLNIQSLEEKSAAAKAASHKSSSGLTFTGIDTLNLTLQKLRMSNLDAPTQGQEVNFRLTNQVFHDIKSEADLTQMAVLLAARSGAATQSGKSGIDTQKLLQQLFH
ncbi:MAG: hypothetical protein ABSF38_14715 [Verrucomicrobiota bacterium]|jgi:hypothetical protein